jgi:hypothetical protein
MANRGYDVGVDVDQEVYCNPNTENTTTRKLTEPQGDLGHTDLQEDLEFHSSSKLPHHPSCSAF